MVSGVPGVAGMGTSFVGHPGAQLSWTVASCASQSSGSTARRALATSGASVSHGRAANAARVTSLVPSTGVRASLAAAGAACATAIARGSARRPQRQRESRMGRAAAATNFATVIEQRQKVGKKEQTADEAKTSKDYWAVMAHAPIVNCTCNSLFNKIPGVRRWVCKCEGQGGNSKVNTKTKDGRCALTVEEYAEVLAQGVPLLSRKKAYLVSSALFGSALANPVGTVMVIGSFKKAAEEYEKRLTDLGLWVSIVPIDKD